MTKKIEIAPELIADGKRLYEETDVPIHAIAARMGITRPTLYERIAEWKWTPRRYSSAELVEAVPAAVADEGVPLPSAERPPMPFTEWLPRIVAGQMAAIERTLNVLGPANSAEAERTARILATIARTVQEIKATAEGRVSTDETNNDPVPRDMDVFRETLALRIRSFIDDEQRGAGADNGETPNGDDGTGP